MHPDGDFEEKKHKLSLTDIREIYKHRVYGKHQWHIFPPFSTFALSVLVLPQLPAELCLNPTLFHFIHRMGRKDVEMLTVKGCQRLRKMILGRGWRGEELSCERGADARRSSLEV